MSHVCDEDGGGITRSRGHDGSLDLYVITERLLFSLSVAGKAAEAGNLWVYVTKWGRLGRHGYDVLGTSSTTARYATSYMQYAI